MSQDVLFRYPNATPEQLAKTHELQRIEVAHDPAVSFSLLKPQAMSVAMPNTFEPAPGMPEPLAAFGLPPSLAGPRLGVSSHRLEWEVDPLEWLRWLATRSGWQIALAKTHPSQGGPRYEVAALREKYGEVIVRRTVAVRSGSRLVRCDASAPMEQWRSWHDALWHALQSFRLGRPSTASVEELTVRRGPLLGFAMPGSWDARLDGDAGGVRWAVQPIRDVQRGAALVVQAAPLTDVAPAEQRRAALWRDLAATDARVGGVLAADRPEFAELVPGWLGQWQAALQTKGGDGVVVMMQREHDGVALDYVLTAPAAGTEHVDWMRATRALDLVMATSHPMLPTDATLRTPA